MRDFADLEDGDQRVIAFVGYVAVMLHEGYNARTPGVELVFPSPKNPTQPRNMRQAFDVARRRAGMANARFHDLRHDAATSMLRNGVDSRVVATVLGHRSLNMMRRAAASTCV